jgi:tetratricopeptide (TPR) repeat protein
MFLFMAKRSPSIPCGMGYYLMAIFPATGIVQVGNQAAADRFSYSTTLSFYILLGAGALWFLEKKGPSFYKSIKHGIIVLGVFILTFLAYQDNRQIKVWKDGVSLWTHVIKYYPERIPIAYNNLGVALSAKGNTTEAAAMYREGIKLAPDYAEAHYNFGNLLRKQEYFDEAVDHYKEAIRLKPGYVKAHSNLGIALSFSGRPDEAIIHYKETIKLDPNFAVAYLNYGNTLAQQGRFEESIIYLEKALKNDPDLTQAHYILGRVFSIVGKDEDAEKHLNLAKELEGN